MLRMFIYAGGVVLLFLIQDIRVFLTCGFVAFCVFIFFPDRKFRSGLIPITIFLSITFVSNLMFKNGRIIFNYLAIEITQEGLYNAAVITIKVFLMVIGAKLMMYGISVEELIGAVGRLLRPLRILKIPVDEFTELMLLTLKAFPLLKDELKEGYTQKITERSLMENKANDLLGKAAAASSLFLPMLINILINPERFFKKND